MAGHLRADPPRWARGIGLACSVLLVTAGVGYAAVHAAGSDSHGPEGWPQHVAVGLPLLAAGVVAGLGARTGRPGLMIAGGVAAMPICAVSVIGLPALLPAAVLVALGAGRLRGLAARDVLVCSAIVALLVGGFAYEVLHQDPAQWATPDGSVGSSNIVTLTESSVAFITVALSLALAVAVAVVYPAGRGGVVGGVGRQR